MSKSMNAVAVLEVMWDWRARTSSAGYAERAPSSFSINPDNHTGRRLYYWLGEEWDGTVTNACPELVSSAKGRGKPDEAWLQENLHSLWTFDILLVCGRVAQRTFQPYLSMWIDHPLRIIYTPHPAARGWTNKCLETTKRLIRTSKSNLRIDLSPTRGMKVLKLEI